MSKWKWIAVFALFVIGMSLGNAPVVQATTCKECLLEPCAPPDPAYGWVINRTLVQNGSSLVLVHNFKCDSLLGGALYWDCQEYGGCASFHNKPGLLFHLDPKSNKVTVFNLKDRKEGKVIQASLNYQGLDVTVKTWKPRVVLPANELVNPSIQTLALLGFAESGSCTVAGK